MDSHENDILESTPNSNDEESSNNPIIEDGDAAHESRKGRPKRGRKRKFEEQSRADRKRLLSKKKKHFNTRGQSVDPKVFDENFVCRCMKKCTKFVPLELRRKLFQQFYDMGTHEGRCTLLISCVSEHPKKRSYTAAAAPSKRTVTRKYTIFNHTVCKVAFLRTLQINADRVELAINKQLHAETYADLRGQTAGGWNKLPSAKFEEVCAHIEKFPKYVSHYTRSQTESKFLSPNLNLSKMYDLYKVETENAASKSFYKKVFYTHFNLRFKKPKKDTCKTCDIYAIKIQTATAEERLVLEKEHDAHLERAEALSKRMKDDLKLAATDPKVETATFDQQKTHNTPKIPTNIVYYKRQLNLYNLGIHVSSNGKGIFNVWLETEASKGTQEVGSCLRKYINSEISAPVEFLILWADSCGGQNRSINLVLMLMHILQNHPSLKKISIRFLQSGHSFLPNDSEFGDVECMLKTKEAVLTDLQYIEVMRDCRKKNKFDVQLLTKEDFFSVQLLEKEITNRKIDCNNTKINWFDTHEIVIEKCKPFIMEMKTTVDGASKSVNIKKRGGNSVDFETIHLEKLWPNGRPLSSNKLKDLKELLVLVPDEYKSFYDFLNDAPTNDFTDDVDGYGESIDFKVEGYDD